MSNEVADFLNQAKAFDGEKHEPFKFTSIGDTAKGVIVEQPRVIDHTDHFNPGQTKTSLVVNLRTDDGEIKTLWVEAKKAMAQAVFEACEEQGVTSIAEGGTLAVRYTEDKDTGKGNPMKVFKAAYQAPAPATDVSDLL